MPARSASAVRRMRTLLRGSSRQLVQAQAGPLGTHEQLGVEKPPVVGDGGHDLARDAGAHGLEAALRIAEPTCR